MKISALAAIVTGGASGLGGAVAGMLAKAGAKVTIFVIVGWQGFCEVRCDTHVVFQLTFSLQRGNLCVRCQ